jgi:hypothetical protein
VIPPCDQINGLTVAVVTDNRAQMPVGTLEIKTGESVATGQAMKDFLIKGRVREGAALVLQGDPDQVMMVAYKLSLSCGIPLRQSSWNGQIAK